MSLIAELDPSIHRVQAFKPMPFVFLTEPMAAVRMNYKSRWTAPVGSPEWKYVRWKDEVRDLFDQMDYRNPEVGMPFSEPMSTSGLFLVSDNSESKDLDNLVKAIQDSMNPERNKDWSKLRTFLWLDDKRVKHFGQWYALPSTGSRIEIWLTPMWGRIDPMINYIQGTSAYCPDRSTSNEYAYSMTVANGYSFLCRVPRGVAQPVGMCRLWVVDSLADGTHLTVTEPEQVVLYRELLKLPRVGHDIAWSILSMPWHDVLSGLSTGKGQYWASTRVPLGKANSIISALRVRFANPAERWAQLVARFDPCVFESVAVLLSKRLKTAWPIVRSRLAAVDLNWKAGVDEVIGDAAAKLQEVKDGVGKRKSKRD